MNRIFIDTSAFYALADRSEARNHESAKILFLINDNLWISSNYIFDELATLLLNRTRKSNALRYLDGIRKSDKIEWTFLKEDDESKAFEIFKDFTDKNWSFTDCTSYIILKKRNIDKILTFDHHFKQMGFTTLP